MKMSTTLNVCVQHPSQSSATRPRRQGSTQTLVLAIKAAPLPNGRTHRLNHSASQLETSRCVLTGCRARAQSRGIGLFYWSTFTARATTRAVVDSAMIDWNDIRALAHLLSGMVSVGENANTLVRLT